jgi:hypothetical protein
MKKQVQDIADSDKDSKQIENSLTNNEIDNMLIDLKSNLQKYNSQQIQRQRLLVL